MRWPRLRFRLWWLMILVAVVALICGGVILRQRSVGFARRASLHQRLMAAEQAKPPRQPGDLPISVNIESQGEINFEEFIAATIDTPQESQEAAVAYHARMVRRYRYAAAHPWITTPEPTTPRNDGGYRVIETTNSLPAR